MSRNQKAPLLAFVLVALVCGLVLVDSVRGDARGRMVAPLHSPSTQSVPETSPPAAVVQSGPLEARTAAQGPTDLPDAPGQASSEGAPTDHLFGSGAPFAASPGSASLPAGSGGLPVGYPSTSSGGESEPALGLEPGNPQFDLPVGPDVPGRPDVPGKQEPDDAAGVIHKAKKPGKGPPKARPADGRSEVDPEPEIDRETSQPAPVRGPGPDSGGDADPDAPADPPADPATTPAEPAAPPVKPADPPAKPADPPAKHTVPAEASTPPAEPTAPPAAPDPPESQPAGDHGKRDPVHRTAGKAQAGEKAGKKAGKGHHKTHRRGKK